MVSLAFTYATYYSAGFWPNINPLWPEYNFLPKIIKPYFILNNKLNIIRCLFVVCFKGGMSTRAFLGFPLCLTDVSVFAEIPKVVRSLCTITVVWEPGPFKIHVLYLIIAIWFFNYFTYQAMQSKQQFSRQNIP